MRKGLSLGAVALVLALGAACGAQPHALPRYVYYPAGGDTSASADAAPADTLPADASDDPSTVDYVNATPAATAQPAPVPGPSGPTFGAPNAIGRVEIP